MIVVRLVEEPDLLLLAQMYIAVYEKTNPSEIWTNESAYDFIRFFYNNCADLFFVLEVNGVLAGATWGQIKPWWNGNKIYNFEIFVCNEHQNKGLSKQLLLYFFTEAREKYSVSTIEVITFSDRTFPLCYYEKLSIIPDKQLILLEGNMEEIVRRIKDHD